MFDRRFSGGLLAAALCVPACTATVGDAATPDAAFMAPDGDPDADLLPPDAAGAACQPDVVESPATPACAAATRNCLDGCQDDACFDDCVAADPDPSACDDCLDDAFIACANEMSCQDEWNVLSCCVEECADPESLGCCPGPIDGWDTCAADFEVVCDASVDSLCFLP